MRESGGQDSEFIGYQAQTNAEIREFADSTGPPVIQRGAPGPYEGRQAASADPREERGILAQFQSQNPENQSKTQRISRSD